MIEIGDNVYIIVDCFILQYDYSWVVMQCFIGEVLGLCGMVCIGNNVFIGQKLLIFKGVEIGDNIIIGVGSVVIGYLEGNVVYVGVLVKKIFFLDVYVDKWCNF